MESIHYICGNCFVPDVHSKDGFCDNCDADMWIEERDFEYNIDFILKLFDYDINKMTFIKNQFKYYKLFKKEKGHVIYKNEFDGSQHSFPIRNKK